jgi:hypothetical protein
MAEIIAARGVKSTIIEMSGLTNEPASFAIMMRLCPTIIWLPVYYAEERRIISGGDFERERSFKATSLPISEGQPPLELLRRAAS